MTQPDFDDFMGGGSFRSFQFLAEGDSISGTILEPPEKLQQTDIDSGEPKFWGDGKPKWYFRIKLQTSLKEDDDDDGIRSLSLAWHRLNAVRAAVTAAGEKTLKVGGQLWIRFDAFEDRRTAKYKTNLAKVGWSARYKAPDHEPEFMGPTATETDDRPWGNSGDGDSGRDGDGGSVLDQMRRQKAEAENKLAKAAFNAPAPTPAKDALRAEMAARGPQPADPPF